MRSEIVGQGENCPKCGGQMGRYRHPKGWQPKPNQAYYYTSWDKCHFGCGHIQHYDANKIVNSGATTQKSP